MHANVPQLPSNYQPPASPRNARAHSAALSGQHPPSSTSTETAIKMVSDGQHPAEGGGLSVPPCARGFRGLDAALSFTKRSPNGIDLAGWRSTMAPGRDRRPFLSATDESTGNTESESGMKTVATLQLMPSGRNQHRANARQPKLVATLLTLMVAACLCEAADAQQIQFRPGELLQAANQALDVGTYAIPRSEVGRHPADADGCRLPVRGR